jgi:ribosomal RNA-processing protein 36
MYHSVLYVSLNKIILNVWYYSLLAEKRILDLVEQYEELKESGKLRKHIQKHRKKNAQKDRKKLQVVDHM